MTLEEELDFVDTLTKLDPAYRQMLQMCRILEKQFLTVLKNLSAEDNDLVWDYVMLCDDMSQRKLKLTIEQFMK